MVIRFATMLLFEIGDDDSIGSALQASPFVSFGAFARKQTPNVALALQASPLERHKCSRRQFFASPPRRPPRGLGHAALDSDHAECEKEKIPHASMNRQACQVTYIELITSTFLPIHPPKITHLLPKIKITGATCAHCGRFLYMDICRDSHPGYLNSKTLFSGWDSATTPRRVLLPILKNNTIALRIKTTLIQNIQSGQPYLIQICKKVRVGQESTWLQILN